jgi:hypothetical protein
MSYVPYLIKQSRVKPLNKAERKEHERTRQKHERDHVLARLYAPLPGASAQPGGIGRLASSFRRSASSSACSTEHTKGTVLPRLVSISTLAR